MSIRANVKLADLSTSRLTVSWHLFSTFSSNVSYCLQTVTFMTDAFAARVRAFGSLRSCWHELRLTCWINVRRRKKHQAALLALTASHRKMTTILFQPWIAETLLTDNSIIAPARPNQSIYAHIDTAFVYVGQQMQLKVLYIKEIKCTNKVIYN